MKPGMEIGRKATIEAEVTDQMVAQFEGKVIHPVYSTVSMVYHMEWASRQIILPFLEEHEEGMGASVSVKHLAPSAVGTKIRVTAELTKIKGNLIYTDVEVFNEKGMIGKGEVVQAILPKEEIKRNIERSKLTTEKM